MCIESTNRFFSNESQATSSAAKEEYLIPGFFLAGVIAALMPLVAGFIGILTMATYGTESGLSSYLNIAQLASDT